MSLPNKTLRAARASEKQATTEYDPSPKELEEASDKRSRPNDKDVKHKMSVADQDAALMNAWKDREGSLANTEFEDGDFEGGYRRNVPTSSVIYDDHLTPQFLTSVYPTWLTTRIVRAPSGVDSRPGSVVSVVAARLSLRLLPLLSVC
ncbi:hypothetical protein OH76DRAFT_53600 [Lentinus brumalis]|uniref:Uncharacterized protein n=1 Tax=Lentinus brumalis TaxID=2498619 RepID=A0A371DYJ0_9APHY|nr:hypothetical protein OH76DRAFT_53600 [Polyporus brumalis]